jgi:hypothetical protein
VQPARNQQFREDFGFVTSIIGLITGFVSLGIIISRTN